MHFRKPTPSASRATCTKHNYLVKDPADLAATITEAFRIATTGRPGPVVIDIPKDVQIAVPSERRTLVRPGAHRYAPQMVAPARNRSSRRFEMIAGAERPILYTGGGVINSGPEASELLRRFQDIVGAPVTSTLMGLGAFPSTHPIGWGCWGCTAPSEATWQ